jgi:hypothetical protein
VGQDPLAETRVAIGSQRLELERTADQLRESLDLRKQFRENPVPFIAVGAGALFLIVGGPGRVAGLVRRQFFPSNAEKAYDALPKPMQSWVDHMTDAVGPRASEARQALAEELVRWRSDPRKFGKVNKKLARQIAEGPPGPKRTIWSAAEAGASILVVALARKAVERLLAGDPDASAIAPPPSDEEPKARRRVDPPSPPQRRSNPRGASASRAASDYSGISDRDRN